MGLESKAKCATCGNYYDPDNPEETHPYRHPIDGPLTNGSKEPEGQRGSPQMPSDPILRYILINKGVISVSELTEAEEMLRASGMVLTNPTTQQDGSLG